VRGAIDTDWIATETAQGASREEEKMRARKLMTITGVAMAILVIPAMASAAIKIKAIYFDPPGSDTGGNINQEFVVIENTGNNRVNLDGWRLRDRAGHVYRFDDFRLNDGARVRVHTGHGQDDNNDLYWDSGSYIWNNDGDKATLRRDNGTVADTCRYTAAASSPKIC
jgi:hypothetical protein